MKNLNKKYYQEKKASMQVIKNLHKVKMKKD